MQRGGVTVQRWIIGSSVENVAALRRRVTAFAAQNGAAEDVRDAVAIAVGELVTNVVLHGHRGDQVPVVADARDDDILVTVSGAGFGLSEKVNGPAARLGMMLVAALTDDIQVAAAEGGGHEISMTFRRAAPHRGC
jgi:anti-sigma regulatory factor (Ser/Thr protein kinase)